MKLGSRIQLVINAEYLSVSWILNLDIVRQIWFTYQIWNDIAASCKAQGACGQGHVVICRWYYSDVRDCGLQNGSAFICHVK